MKKYLLLLIISLLFNHLFGLSCTVNKGGALDGLLVEFNNSAHNWQYIIEPIAKKLFYTLFAMEFMWQLTVKKVFAGDIEKLWVFFFVRISLCFFFAKYLINIKLYQQIISYVANLGSSLSGFNVLASLGHGVVSLGPSEIISNVYCMTDAIHQLTDNTGTFDYITLKITMGIMQILLMIFLLYIAYQLTKVILQTYFLLYIGFILTGFSGSSWTYEFWERYIRAIAGIMIKFLAFCFIFGVIAAQMRAWSGEILEASNIIQLSSIVFKVFGSSFIYALLISQLPEWAASTLTGSIRMGHGFSNMMSGK